jgi:hypothetical protein
MSEDSARNGLPSGGYPNGPICLRDCTPSLTEQRLRDLEVREDLRKSVLDQW